MMEQPTKYQSYLLRLWGEEQNTHIIWRASLENAQTHERHSFADLLELFAFLYLQRVCLNNIIKRDK